MPLCRCGNSGCPEAYAAGCSLARQLAGRGGAEDSAQAASLLNPSLVVWGGPLAASQDHLLAGVRETIYRRSLPLATRNLQILASQLVDDAALIGGAHLVADAMFEPQAVDSALLAQAV